MTQSYTQVTDWGIDELTRRLIENFPRDWSSDEARSSIGKLYTIFHSLAVPLDHVVKQIIFLYNTSRLQDATDVGLDLIASDFFDDIRRIPGELDADFRARIAVNLFSEKVTIRGISNAITRLTGNVPTIREPWNPHTFPIKYWNVLNSHGTFWGHNRMFAPELRYQLFIEAQLPGFPSQGAPIYTLDHMLCLNVARSAWYRPQAAWQRSKRELYQTIVATKPVGVTAWVHTGVAKPL